MSSHSDSNVRELGTSQLKLRSDLSFTPQPSSTHPYFMVEDRLNSRFFRLGHTEYTFVSLLDGKTTIQEAFTHLSTVLPNHRLTNVDAAGLCRWLVEMDLAHTTDSSQASRLAKNAQTAEQRKTVTKLNPLGFRIPLGHPDRIFVALNQSIGWIYSPLAVACCFVLLAIGAFQVLDSWDQFTLSSQGIFASDNWLWLLVSWAVLKVVHEASHGIVCKRHGGTVRETGIMFVFFAPLAYVDVTSSWRFRSRRQRIYVAAAGMYIELLIAALAAIVWGRTDSPWLSNLCFNIIAMASLTTILFNANPLMKFDGYYMLSDALSLPNLSVNGQTYLNYWGRRYLLGEPAILPDWSVKHGVYIRIYAWASLIWRLLICVTLIVAAATMFHGAGIVLAALAMVMWIGMPTLRFVNCSVFGKVNERLRWSRFLSTVGVCAASSIVIFGFTPWPGSCEAPAVVEYSPHTVIRAASSGFVKTVYVEAGQCVNSGQLLIELENRDLVHELHDIELQIDQSELRSRQHEQKSELAAEQSETHARDALRTQLAEKRTQVEHLTIYAPSAGMIVRRDLASFVGRYLREGDELLAIGDEASKELRLSVSQEDLDVFTQCRGKAVCINIPGESLRYSKLEQVIPRATLAVPHPALATTNGGSLPVKPVSSHSKASDEDPYELISPHFTAIVPLNESDSRDLHSGQRVWVSYRPMRESIGQHLYYAASNWIRSRLMQ